MSCVFVKTGGTGVFQEKPKGLVYKCNSISKYLPGRIVATKPSKKISLNTNWIFTEFTSKTRKNNFDHSFHYHLHHYFSPYSVQKKGGTNLKIKQSQRMPPFKLLYLFSVTSDLSSILDFGITTKSQTALSASDHVAMEAAVQTRNNSQWVAFWLISFSSQQELKSFEAHACTEMIRARVLFLNSTKVITSHFCLSRTRSVSRFIFIPRSLVKFSAQEYFCFFSPPFTLKKAPSFKLMYIVG